MKELDSKELRDFSESLADRYLTRIEWEGDDLLLPFCRQEAADQVDSMAIRFCFVTNLTVSMQFELLGGPGLVFEARFEHNQGVWYYVTVDCAGAPAGAISFRCDGVLLEEA